MERGGSSRPVCKWHPRQQGEGVCAQCLRTSLEKLAAYQGEYQDDPLDLQPETFSSSSLAEFSRDRDSNFHLFQPNYSSVSYRTRSKKEVNHDSQPRVAVIQKETITPEPHKQKDSSRPKPKLSWGGAVQRIGLIRSAFTSLWRSDRRPDEHEEKRKGMSRSDNKYQARIYGQSGPRHERKERIYGMNGERYGGSSEKSIPVLNDPVHSDLDLRHTENSERVNPKGGSSFFITKFTHRSSSGGEDSQVRWRRSKSNREAKRETEDAPIDQGPRTPNIHQELYDAPSPQLVPHPTTKTSPWRFFSRSASRRSPHWGSKPYKIETPVTPDAKLPLSAGSKSNPMSHGVSPKPEPSNSSSKSALSSPSMAKLDSRTTASHGSKSTSWSRTLSTSSSNKPSPLYLAGKEKEHKVDDFVKDLESAQELLPSLVSTNVTDVQDSDAVTFTSLHPKEESIPTVQSKSSSRGPTTAQNKAEKMLSGQKANQPRSALRSNSPVSYKRADIPKAASQARRNLSSGAVTETPLYRKSRGKAALAS